MKIKELQNELSRIKKYYQMTGEDANAMETAIGILNVLNKVVYICDPDKNKKCRRTNCNTPGGCFLTTKIEYSKCADPLVIAPIWYDFGVRKGESRWQESTVFIPSTR